MKNLLFCCACLLITLLPSLAARPWKLVWSDEFNYSGLPDPNKWDYEEGFVRNNEMQYYTRARLENAHVGHGVLTIEGRKEAWKNPVYTLGAHDWQTARASAAYTSACLVTRHKFSWTYGRIEVRAKLPAGKGVWPAIWLLGDNIDTMGWPACGEIDLMEYVGHTPQYIWGTLHYSHNGEHASSGGKLLLTSPTTAFHKYAIEWSPERIDFFVDSTKYHAVALDVAGSGADNPFRKPQYLLINLALGGDWGGAIDDTRFPQKYVIDYVRIYQPTKHR
jgi:beta-glucanase (GH16 family)